VESSYPASIVLSRGGDCVSVDRLGNGATSNKKEDSIMQVKRSVGIGVAVLADEMFSPEGWVKSPSSAFIDNLGKEEQ
jgi:hypothetical protein